tara:strand:+ start:57089 stop:58243 length:1155 start_codon:yes stop_codon:yes gene_type:complete
MRHLENENRTLEDMLHVIKEQNDMKQDYIAPTNQLQFRTLKNEGETAHSQIVMEANQGEPTKILNVNQHCFDQIAQKAEIATPTARRLQQNYPREMDNLINAIWQKENSKRMIRTFENSNHTNPFNYDNHTGTARAFLSDKFKTFDNSDLLESALPTLGESDASWKIVNYANTDKKLYIRLKSEVIQSDAGLNDLMAHGIGISNSETGSGSVAVFGIAWTLACLNGMQTENVTRKAHITSARDGDTWNVLTDETKQADNHSLKLQLRDIVSSYASRDAFDENIEKMKRAKEDVVNVPMNESVENLGKVLTLSKKETSNVLEGLLQTIGQSGYEQNQKINRATLVNACTAVGNTSDPDNVDFWQRLGGKVLNLGKTDWNRVAMAS